MIWAARNGSALIYIQPGKPRQNACVARYSRTVGHEGLDLCIFESLGEVRSAETESLRTYNNDRPNMGIGGAPAQN